MNAQFSRSDLKLRAKSKVANVRGDSVVVTLVYIIIIGAVNGVASGIGGALTAVNLNAGVFVNIIGMGASLLLAPVFTYGYVLYCRNIVTGAPQSINNLFAGFNQYSRVICTGLLVALYTFLWSLLFIIPGIIASYRYRFAYQFIIDYPEMTATQAIEASKMMTRGRKMDLFVLDLSFIGWNLLVGLTCGILGLWIAPYEQASVQEFYEYYKFLDMQNQGNPFQV